MVYIQSEIKRGILRQIAAGAANSGNTLYQSLLTAQGSVYSPSFAKGKIISSFGGNGQSGSYEIGISAKGFTQENVFAMLEQFLEVLASVIAAGLGIDSGNQSDTQNLFTVMCQDDRLAGVRTEMGDWTSLNIPSIGGVPAS